MQQPFICTKFLDHFLFLSRKSGKGVKISQSLYSQLRNLVEEKSDGVMPLWFKGLLKKLDIESAELNLRKLSDVLLVRKLSIFSFGKASYEITNDCNYRCRHCLLDKREGRSLGMEQRKKILDLVERAGCLWLQITGGEPLADRYFLETYRYAYTKGLLITISTNGSLLSRPRIMETLKEYPPYRIAVSVYGATKSSYEALTRTKGSFRSFVRGVEVARGIGMEMRLNLIMTKFNEKEVGMMKMFAEELGVEHFVYPHLSPTLSGQSFPLEIAAGTECGEMNERSAQEYKENEWQKRCLAGRRFFYIDCLGRASICNIARGLKADLIKEGEEGLKKFPLFAEALLAIPTECTSCDLFSKCSVCPPRLSLYKRSGFIPSRICPIQS